MKIILKLFT